MLDYAPGVIVPFDGITLRGSERLKEEDGYRGYRINNTYMFSIRLNELVVVHIYPRL